MVDNTPTVRSQIESKYEWRNPDTAEVAATVTDVVFPFFAPEPTFSGSLKRDGVQAFTEEHTSLDTWKTALSTEWDKFHIYLDKDSRNARIDFSLKQHEISITLNTTGSDTGWLTDFLVKFQKSMSLGPARSSGYQPKESLEGQYRVQNSQDVSWFKTLLEKLERWAGQPKYYNGSFTLDSAPHFTQSPATYSDWKKETLANWQHLLECNVIFQNPDREFSLRYYANRGELSLTLSSYNSNELTELFHTLEKELQILPFANKVDASSPKGEQRRYFVSQTINAAWFEQASTLIGTIAKDAASFQGRFRTGLSGEESSRHKFEEWRNEVKSRWDDLIWVYCWVYTNEITIRMDIDLLRDLVSMELKAPNEETIQRHLNALEIQLKLVKTGENPYQYRRFLRAFEIKRWTSSEKYAEALKAAVDFAFGGRVPGRRVAMTTAYVAVGDREEDLDPFHDYQTFLQRLARTEDPNLRSQLVLEGPNGRLVGVMLDRKAKRLTIRTSLERSELDNLTLPFRNAMGLSLEESKDEPEKGKEDKPKLTWLMVVTAIFSILAALWSGTVAVFTSQRGLTPFRDQYVIEITHPVGESGKPITVNGQEVRIEWRLTKKDLTGDHLDLRSNASVEVVPDENPRDARTYPGTGGAVVVPFSPGSYWVRVVSDVDRNSAASVKVTVPKPEDEKQTKPTKPPGNRR